MPAFTPIRDFIEALKSGQTNMTRRLDYLYANRASIDVGVLATLRTGTLHPTFPAEVKALLKGTGAVTGPNKLSDPEINHMEGWDSGEKTKVQGWIDTAMSNGYTVSFFWELHRGPPAGDYAVQVGPDAAGNVAITFRTYAGRVNLSPSLGSISYT